MEPQVEKPAATQVVNLSDGDDFDAFLYQPMPGNGFLSVDEAIDLAIGASIQTSYQQELMDLAKDYCFIDGVDFEDLTLEPQGYSSSKHKQVFEDSVTVMGQSSSAGFMKDPDFVCAICVEAKATTDMFFIKGCIHVYCTECMVNYVDSKLEDNITTINCPEPECKGVLESEDCLSFLPRDVFDRWNSALCEAMFLGYKKIYCPYKNCSGMLLDDGDVAVQQAECPHCRRLFCAECKVAWHSGIKCEDFQKLHKDERETEDIMLMNLAQNKNWRRCPSCRIFVERTEGCKYMKCRCRTSFCYTCGSTDMDTKPIIVILAMQLGIGRIPVGGEDSEEALVKLK